MSAVTNLQPKPLPGYRLIDGSLISNMIDTINNITVNGTTRNLTSKTLSITVTATANTDFTVSIPSGALIRSMSAYTTTAFTAGTDAKISVGSTVGGVDYVAATSIAAVGVVALTLVAAAAGAFANFTAGTLNVRLAQTGTATAVGAATLVVSFDVPTT